ncbi:MAG: mechanosensitive ion channel family protein [Candidatus Omnitrophica bacterium]|nr:mechanosensitive ion channel family protein [Candidatus Omnitrophota bacterium]
MDEILKLLFEKITEYSIPLTIFCLVLALGLTLRKILLIRLNRWSKQTPTRIDDIIVAAIRGPLYIWCLMLGIYLALQFSSLELRVVQVFNKTILVLGIISVTLVFSHIVVNLIKIYSEKLGEALPATSLTQNIARIIIFGIGILIILNSLGISITPILATLGVGGLAVALALQETLSNLFAGFHVIAARQVKIGDYIKLDSGEEGYVVDINWRTTKIKMLPNNAVLVPNEKMIKSIITNYYLPEREMSVLVNLGIHYNSDLEKAEKVTCEVAKEVMREVPGGVPTFEPFIRYNGFGEFSINFTVILRAKEFTDQYLVKHEFIKRLHERYRKEGIIIPYPIRAINYEQEKTKE